MAKITVDANKCKGCGMCVSVCPVGMYELKAGKAAVKAANLPNCLECHACETQCPQSAIKVS